MSANPYPAISGDGGLVPADLRTLVYALSPDLDGGERRLTSPTSFGIRDGRDRRAIDESIGRAWKHAGNHWRTFTGYRTQIQATVREGRPTGARNAGYTDTRDHLLLPLLRLLGYEPEARREAEEVGGRRYTLSHRHGDLPLHLTTFLDDLDGAPEYGPTPAASITGARRVGPHAAMQEYLNRREGATYGVISNGLIVRLLAPNPSLTRLQYLEFDLEAIFEGDLYPDFRLLWLLLHRTRLVGSADATPPLTVWRDTAMATGTRAMAGLRAQVRLALEVLGTGLITHPRNEALRAALRDGTLTPAQMQSGLLTILYRLLFLLVTEARGQLHAANASADARNRYATHYGVTRLRTAAHRYVGDARHTDLWQTFSLVCTLLGDTDGGQTARRGVLGLPSLGGLFADDPFGGAAGVVHLANGAFATAIHHLSVVNVKEGRGARGRTTLRRVNYADLDVEELGGIYEGLLELVPEIAATDGAASFRFADDSAGGDRKQSGSYYTPRPLVNELVKSALDPVIADRLRGATTAAAREAAILGITVCDPACGSGHFLLAAAERLAGELATARADGREPSVTDVRIARRDVIAHCLYGVDANPMAVDLCRVALWLAGYHEGTPLGFLDHRIRCGNSLVGASPDPDWLATMAGGVPPEAFGASTDPEIKALIAQIKKANRPGLDRSAKGVAQGRLGLFDEPAFTTSQKQAAVEVTRIVDGPESSAADVGAKARAYADWVRRHRDRLRAPFDAWVAAFFWPLDDVAVGKAPWPPLSDDFGRGDDAAVQPPNLAHDQRIVVADLAATHRFFHWPIEFPEVFVRGGFDCVLGNPPWERIKVQEKEFFAVHAPGIANAANAAARKEKIKALRDQNPSLWQSYRQAVQGAEFESTFARQSGRFALTGRGDVNLYALFAEHGRALVNGRGRAGVIVPTGIATDDATKYFLGDLVTQQSLATLFDFENRYFDAVDSRMKFCLLTMAGGHVARGDLAFFLHDVAELRADAGRRFQLTADDFALINPNTRTCPTFRTRADADLTRAIYQRVPVLIREAADPTDAAPPSNPWGVQFMRMLDMSNDSESFRDDPSPGLVPLYEAKFFHQYTHRWATWRDGKAVDATAAELADPHWSITPRYWIDRKAVTAKLAGTWDRGWVIAFRDIARSTDERTWIAGVMPPVGVGHTAPLVLPKCALPLVPLLIGGLASIPADYVVRQKVGGTHLTYTYVKQFPVLPPESYPARAQRFITPRVVELTYTAWELQAFARDMGMDGAPFRWDEGRRATIRAELDAVYAQLYGLHRKQLRYILDPHALTAREIDTLVADDAEDAPDAPRVEGFPGETFRVLKDRELREYGEYRTGRLVLEAWDRLARCGWDLDRYASPLAVPAGDAKARHQA